MKNYLLFLLFLGVTTGLKAQSAQEVTLESNDQFQISYTKGECVISENLKPFEYGFVKVKNLTNKVIKLGFNIVTEFDGGCDGCDGGDESRFYIDLQPNQVYQATCKTEDRSLFMINNPNFDGSWKFEKAFIQNLNIIK